MTVPHRVVALLLQHEPGAGWPAEFVARLLTRSSEATPPEQRSTAADYWWDCTMGLVDLSGRVVATALLPSDDESWTAARQSPDPGVDHLAGLTDVVRRTLTREDVDGATGLLVVSSLPVARPYAADVRLGRRRLPTALVGAGTSHMVLVHELGHVFGFEHPWGLYTEAAGTASREYGSPYCVMGTARRFTSVCTSLDPWPDTPNDAEPGFFDIAGPRLSMAELVAWLLRGPDRRAPELPWLRTVSVPEATEGPPVTVQLTHQDGPADLPRAVLAQTPDGRRFVVEVRRPLPDRAVDWDARLDLLRRHNERPGRAPSKDLDDGPGVVMHTIEDLPGPTGIKALLVGRRLRRPRRSVYVGAIPLPASGDLDVSSPDAAPWVARLVGSTEGDDVVTVEIGAVGSAPTAGLDWSYVDDDPHHIHLQAHTVGFERPELRWRAAGVQLPWLRVGDGHVQRVYVGRVVTPTADPVAPAVAEPASTGTSWRPVPVRLQASWDQLCVHAEPVGGSYSARITLEGRDWIQVGIGCTATVRLRLGGPGPALGHPDSADDPPDQQGEQDQHHERGLPVRLGEDGQHGAAQVD